MHHIYFFFEYRCILPNIVFFLTNLISCGDRPKLSLITYVNIANFKPNIMSIAPALDEL